ncbi:hypothetical protein Y032_0257g395 [Ancylostoma ceylanicum]|uniref:Uncharacterized protein n=1 Tax=Ancylostoma ceylanicum TaxID=53326 RepID=A0A016SAS7_9BILA|nr:hypothetical protein Y032_0257g395 [Ancylostoma ceylanicum]
MNAPSAVDCLVEAVHEIVMIFIRLTFRRVCLLQSLSDDLQGGSVGCDSLASHPTLPPCDLVSNKDHINLVYGFNQTINSTSISNAEIHRESNMATASSTTADGNDLPSLVLGDRRTSDHRPKCGDEMCRHLISPP